MMRNLIQWKIFLLILAMTIITGKARSADINHRPIALSQTVTVMEDESATIELQATDEDGDELRFEIVRNAVLGNAALLNPLTPSVIYKTARDAIGKQTFTFRVFDGVAYSDPATVTVNVAKAEDAPIVKSQVVNIPMGMDISIILGRDPDGDVLRSTVTLWPTHGTLTLSSQNPAHATYVPLPGYIGEDAFAFSLTDDHSAPVVGTVFLKIEAQLRTDANGWTTLSPAEDSQIIYVSSSEGNDTRDGLSPSPSGNHGPVRTLKRGYELLRDGYPDWMLLKKGDIWIDEALGGEERVWAKSGKSNIERMVIASYGSSSRRPLIKIGSPVISIRGSDATVSNIAILGIHVQGVAAMVDSSEFRDAAASVGLRIDGGRNILFEDLFLEQSDIVALNRTNPLHNFAVRRSSIVDRYAPGGVAIGIQVTGGDNVLLEENLVDHNGWSRLYESAIRPTTDLRYWSSIPDGRLRLSVNGIAHNIDGIDFSHINTMQDVASTLQEAINAKVGDNAVRIEWRSPALLFTSMDGDSTGIIVSGLGRYTGQKSGTDIYGQQGLGTRLVSDVNRFGHNLAITHSHNVTIRGNIIARAASAGIKLKSDVPGGFVDTVIEGNVFVGNAYGIYAGGTSAGTTFRNLSIQDNVFIDAGSSFEDGPHAYGIAVTGIEQGKIERNLFLHQEQTENAAAILIGDSQHGFEGSLSVEENTIFDWKGNGIVLAGGGHGNIAIAKNNIQDPLQSSILVRASKLRSGYSFFSNKYAGNRDPRQLFLLDGSYRNFRDWTGGVREEQASIEPLVFASPSRSLSTYDDQIGGPGSIYHFFDEARTQSKQRWKGAYTADAFARYIKDGMSVRGGSIPVPTSLSAEESDGVIVLRWESDAEADSITIERRVASEPFLQIGIVDRGETQYEDGDIGQGKGIYTYRVRAMFDGNYSAYSPEVTSHIDIAAPEVPAELSAISSEDGGVMLTWLDNSGNEAGFSLERRNGSTGAFQEIASLDSDSTEYLDEEAIGGSYAYRIRSYVGSNSKLYSKFSNVASVSFGRGLAAPQNLRATPAGGTEISLIWSDQSEDEDGFIIERKEEGETEFNVVDTVGPDIGAYTDRSLMPETRYTYRMRAYQEPQYSEYTAEASISTWKMGDADGNGAIDQLDYNRLQEGTRQQLSGWSNGDFNGDGTVDSNDLFLLDTAYGELGKLPAPATLTVTLNARRLNLQWTDMSPDEEDFIVERKGGGGNSFIEIKTLSPNVTSYLDVSAIAGASYVYRIRAHRSTDEGMDDYSAYSNEATGKIPVSSGQSSSSISSQRSSSSTFSGGSSSSSAVTAPRYLSAVSANGRVYLRWVDASLNEDGFDIERKHEGGSFVFIGSVWFNVTAVSDSGVILGVRYTYRVRARKALTYSAYSNEVTVVAVSSSSSSGGSSSSGSSDSGSSSSYDGYSSSDSSSNGGATSSDSGGSTYDSGGSTSSDSGSYSSFLDTVFGRLSSFVAWFQDQTDNLVASLGNMVGFDSVLPVQNEPGIKALHASEITVMWDNE